MTISLCMIVKNEEDNLPRCLDSVKGCVDEIIIVDTGSDDNTREIARAYTPNVHSFKWIDDFSAARNYAFDFATMDYTMWLDADDVLSPEEAEKLIKLKATLPPQTAVVTMLYHTHFDENGYPTLTSTRGRLFRSDLNFRWIDPVHEYVPMRPPIFASDIAISHKSKPHDSDRNIGIYQKRLERGEVFNARSCYYYARELMDHRRYDEAISWFSRFLDDDEGWVEDNIGACLCLGHCYGALMKPQKARLAFYRSFVYDLPRAAVCCAIADSYSRENYNSHAIYWFERALEAGGGSGGFEYPECHGFIPHIGLCVVYDRIGNQKKAAYHNEQAAIYKPNDPSVLHNRRYFERMGAIDVS